MAHRNDLQWDTIVIGGGISGLTAGALLAAEGVKVLVVERHTIAGGCASFFQTEGYRFDVGATVAGGFGPRGLHRKIFEKLKITLAVERLEPAMVVHLGDQQIVRWGDARWQNERLQQFGPEAESFWHLQEQIADRAWELAAGLPALPVDWHSALHSLSLLTCNDVQFLKILGRSVQHLMPNVPVLQQFVDAQLLITAQTTSPTTDALYGLTALDLAREGVFHLPAGLSSIALHLAKGLRQNGGNIRYGCTVQNIRLNAQNRVCGIQLTTGEELSCDKLISAIPISDTNHLLPTHLQIRTHRQRGDHPRWGAFMAYVGLPIGMVADNFPLHHQVVLDPTAPLGEGNSLFFSFSAAEEAQRSRTGGRAVTISTHTQLERWQEAWRLGTYEHERDQLGTALLKALDRLIDQASQRAVVVKFATPHTFESFTGRAGGHVGGQAQTPWYANLLAPSHRSGIEGLVLCGDSVFPGQSTVGVSHSACIAVQQCVQLHW